MWLALAALAACGDNLGLGAKSLLLTPSNSQIPVGASIDVIASYRLGNNATDPGTDVIWSSADPTIATVTPGAVGHATVKGVKAGTTTVTAKGLGLTGTLTVTVTPSTAKEITSFAFLAAKNAGLSADVTAKINGSAITATVPFGTDLTGLIATFTTTGASVAVGSTAQASGTTANDFTSPVMYTVTAADGSTRSYTVTVTVAPSKAKELTAFSFLSASNAGAGLGVDVDATITGTTISATVPFGTTVTGLIATFTTTGASVAVGGTAQVSGTTANDFTSPVTYRVTAADGSTKDYTVTVTVAQNTAKDITAFSFLSANNSVLPADVAATINGTAIVATVPFGTTVTGLVATFTTTGASVKVNGTEQTTGGTANDFTNPVAYTVTAADGSTKTYTVTVTIAANPAKEITAFAFLSAKNPGLGADVVATINGTAIAATVPFGTDVTGLVATFAATGASVKVGTVAQNSGVTANNFTNPVTYTVTAADGSTKDFVVSVTIAKNTAKDITAFAFLSVNNPALGANVTATISGTAITATVPFNTDVTGLVATFKTTGASVAVSGVAQTSGVTANDFTNPVTYTVTAADGSTKDFVVTVIVALNTAKDITAFAFLSANNPGLATDAVGTITGTDIAVTVPFGTSVTGLVATFADTGISVRVGNTLQASGITANDFTAPVIYTVTAGDTSTQDFTVTVTVAKNTAKDITAFAFPVASNPALGADVTATVTGTAITATVPFGTDVTALVATFTTTGASVAVGGVAQTSGTTANNFTIPVIYTVTADDGSTKDFTVAVTITPPSPLKDITTFAFLIANNPGLTTDVTATITGNAITATLPTGANIAALVATFTTTGVSVKVGATEQLSGATANDFTSPVVYRVTAQDTTTQDFTVTIAPTCPALVNPANGTVSVTNGGVFPATATYTCNTSFVLNGTATLTCGSNGQWSGTAPICDELVMVVRVGNGVDTLSGTSAAAVVDEYRLSDGNLMRTIQLPTAATGNQAAFSLGGSSNTEGNLALSVDNRYVTLVGYNAPPGVTTVKSTSNRSTDATPTNRVVARIDAAGTVDTSTHMVDSFSGDSVRAAVSADGTSFWVSGTSSGGTGATGGVHFVSFGSTGSTTTILTTPDNAREIGIFNGQLYASTGSTNGGLQGVFSIGTGLPTTAGQTGALKVASTNPQGFAFLDRNPLVPGVDTLYLAVAAAATGSSNTINVQKWTFDGTTWTQVVFAPVFTGTATGATGLTAYVSDGKVRIVTTTSETAARLVTLLDDGVTTTPTVTVVATPAAKFAFRGVARSPFVQ